MIRSRHVKLAQQFLAHRWKTLQVFEVQASVLNACNLDCAYCKCPESVTRVMTTAQWRTIIDELAGLGVMRIKFQGGEPTLRKDFGELCAASKDHGIITSVTTNGQRTAAEPVLLDRLDEVVFSLDATDPALNDAQRGKGSHERVMQSIRHARSRSLRIYVNMTVTRRTLTELEPMLDFCENLGIGFNAQPVMFDWGYADQSAQEMSLSDRQIREMHRQMVTWKRQGRRLMFSANTYQRVIDWPDYRLWRRIESGPSRCMAGRFYVHIEPNGDIIPCGFHAGTFEPVNALDSGVAAALNNARSHNCADCGMAYLNERKALFGLKPFAIWELLRRG